MKNKRGQPKGNPAAGLIGIITLLMIFYILFLPPEERDALLNDKSSFGSGTSGSDRAISENPSSIGSVSESELLIREFPGVLDYSKRNSYEYNLPAFTLISTTNAQVLESFNNFEVRNGWFDKKTKTIEFEMKDQKNTNNVLLSFITKKHKGTINIKLNGNLVYEYDIESYNPEPITLKSKYLQRDNVLEFEVSQVGAKFWATNIYALEDVKIIGDYTDISKQESQNVFYIKDEENDNLEKATLKFSPDCTPSRVGKLEVNINGETIFYGIPDCGTLNLREFSPRVLEEGKNVVLFKADAGSYLVDLISVETELEGTKSTYYDFEMEDSYFDNVKTAEDRCGDIDGICPDRCEPYEDKDCCFEEYDSGYWCDIETSYERDRCVGYVIESTCNKCESGYEDDKGDIAEDCEDSCGDDDDNFCPTGCSAKYDKDCCFDQLGDQYWCNDLPTSGEDSICEASISSGECDDCTEGYEGEDKDPTCEPTTSGDTEEKLKSKYDVTMKMEFMDNVEDKEADIYINGRLLHMDTRSDKWERNIDIYVETGMNSIKIVPQSKLEIKELTVDIEN